MFEDIRGVAAPMRRLAAAQNATTASLDQKSRQRLDVQTYDFWFPLLQRSLFSVFALLCLFFGCADGANDSKSEKSYAESDGGYAAEIREAFKKKRR